MNAIHLGAIVPTCYVCRPPPIYPSLLAFFSVPAAWLVMRIFLLSAQSVTRCPARIIGTCVLITLVSASSSNAQTDAVCRQQHFGKFSEWSAAVNLGPVVNAINLDFHPSTSPNELSLYFSSNRPGGILTGAGDRNEDIWVTRRAGLDAPWGAPRTLGPNINTEFRENSPKLSRDGHWLIFGSGRPTGKCVADSVVEFYISYRENADDDFAWEPAVNFGCDFIGKGENLSPAFFHDDDKGITTMYFSSPRTGDSLLASDIYVSTRRFHGAFGPAALVPELNSPVADVAPSIRGDGLEMFFKRGLPPPGPADLMVATRETTSQTWTAPKSLGPLVNTGFDNQQPSLSCDGTTLYFVSNRPGGLGNANYDIYVSTRKKLEEPAPVLLSASHDGSRQGAILHAGTSQVASSSNPAFVGEALEIYATGLVDGSAVAPQITIGDRVADVLFFGKAPGFAGLNQVNVRVPGISPGPAVPVRLTYLGRLSNEVTIGLR
ncbi:MAG: PD40 domain-containing protein [Acidobacteriia bacterium]|nr:PD40 domain-containing protein [Terriglobia bacterium]